MKQFCETQRIKEHSFYVWRKRLREQTPMRFALVERDQQNVGQPRKSDLELVLTRGKRLRMSSGVDAALLPTCWKYCADDLVVFKSRRRNRLKILYCDRDGFALWSKRLEEGTYPMPMAEISGERRREITAQELGALLSGIDPKQCARRKRYQRPAKMVQSG